MNSPRSGAFSACLEPGSVPELARPELTILMTCLNQGRAVEKSIARARAFLARSGISGEILVADNGSTDGSREIAKSNGARVVHIAEHGYGATLAGGIAEARGDYVVMGDTDGSHDFSSLDAFVDALRGGADLVIGGSANALRNLNRSLWGAVAGDLRRGLRGIRRNAILGLDIRSRGRAIVVEMQIKAWLRGFDIATLPPHAPQEGAAGSRKTLVRDHNSRMPPFQRASSPSAAAAPTAQRAAIR